MRAGRMLSLLASLFILEASATTRFLAAPTSSASGSSLRLGNKLRAKQSALINEAYRPLPEIPPHMLPPLKPVPTPLPLPPKPPQSEKPELTYDVGGIYAGKDVTGTWQLLNLTRKRTDDEGAFEADIFQRVVAGEKPVVAAHWTRVMAKPEFLRATPAPPITTPAPHPKFWKNVNVNKTDEWRHMPQQNSSNMREMFGIGNINNGTVNGTYRVGNLTNGTTHNVVFPMTTPAPKIYEIAGGHWPLHWRATN